MRAVGATDGIAVGDLVLTGVGAVGGLRTGAFDGILVGNDEYS